MLEHLIVAAIVLAASLYAIWSVAPNGLKLRLARAVRKRGSVTGSVALIKLGSSLEASAGTGCGNCEQHSPPQAGERKTPL
jgi:hypothetical protein